MTECQQVNVTKSRRVGIITEVKSAGRESGPGSTRYAVGEFGNFGLGRKGQAAEVHAQNALGVTGVLGATESQGRGAGGPGEGELLSDEISLGEGAVGVEVGVVAEAVLVAGGGEGKVGNSWLADGVVAREDGEGGGEGRVEHGCRRRRPGELLVALNPGKLASGVENHLLRLGRCSYGEGDDGSHGIFEGKLVVVGFVVGSRNERVVERVGGAWGAGVWSE